MQEKRVFWTRMHPRKHAQEAIFPVIYSVFLHISTDFDPQESANHRAPPPGYRRENVSAFPTLSVITLPPPLVHLGTMLVPILFLLVFLLCFWLSCFGSRCLRGCCELVGVVGASLLGLSWGMLRRLGVYVGASWDHLLRLCWGLLAYVGPSWDYVGRSWVLCWAILALSWGHLGTMLGFVGLSWAYVGPAWDYRCWAFLGSMLGHLGSVLAYLGACCAMQQLDSL